MTTTTAFWHTSPVVRPDAIATGNVYASGIGDATFEVARAAAKTVVLVCRVGVAVCWTRRYYREAAARMLNNEDAMPVLTDAMIDAFFAPTAAEVDAGL